MTGGVRFPPISATNNLGAMAYKLSEQDSYVTITEKEYLALVKDGMFMAALRLSGVLKKDGVMEAIESLMKDPRVEVHIRPVKKNYR